MATISVSIMQTNVPVNARKGTVAAALKVTDTVSGAIVPADISIIANPFGYFAIKGTTIVTNWTTRIGMPDQYSLSVQVQSLAPETGEVTIPLDINVVAAVTPYITGITLTPVAPVVWENNAFLLPDTMQAGAAVATVAVSMSDGSKFTGGLLINSPILSVGSTGQNLQITIGAQNLSSGIDGPAPFMDSATIAYPIAVTISPNSVTLPDNSPAGTTLGTISVTMAGTGTPLLGGETSVVISAINPAGTYICSYPISVVVVPRFSSGGTVWKQLDADPAISFARASTAAFQNSAIGSWRSVRATSNKSSGKYYFEITVGDEDSLNLVGTRAGKGWLLGVDDGSGALNNYCGSGAHGTGFQIDGTTHNNGASLGSWAGGAFGDVIGVAVDVTNKLIWVQNNRLPNWNVNVMANPAAGVGGYATPAGPLYIMWSGLHYNGNNDCAILNAGDRPFVMTPPSGFAPWDNNPLTLVGGGASPTTLVAGGNLTLSNGNLTVTRGSGSPNGNFWNAVGSTYHTSGKYYYEFFINTLASTGTLLMGLDNNNPGSTWTGSATNGTAFGDDGAVWHGGRKDDSVIGGPSWSGCVQGVYVGIAVDIDHGLMWARSSVAPTNWNGSISTGPISISGGVGSGGAGIAVNGNCYIAVSMSANTDSVTLNSGETPFNMPLPTGYQLWG